MTEVEGHGEGGRVGLGGRHQNSFGKETPLPLHGLRRFVNLRYPLGTTEVRHYSFTGVGSLGISRSGRE